VYQSVSLFVTRLRPAKTVERMDVLFGMDAFGAQRTLHYAGVLSSLGRGEGGERINLAFLRMFKIQSHPPDGVTFDAAIVNYFLAAC